MIKAKIPESLFNQIAGEKEKVLNKKDNLQITKKPTAMYLSLNFNNSSYL